ncbi:hypothetical protein [Pseudomonas sp. Marseille-Q5299]|uniref:hypothetical protein n=1 Tax=Pseudomonas sp. Marseille-Q5299 TaxID=2942201 RepID=UPI002072AC1C|nr:hypothetical protein [Pseudomonas sp. Marseille-Q5299]
MADVYGLRTKDAAGSITLDTTITPIRSIKMMQVTGNNAFEQTVAIPEVKAESFVVVDTLENAGELTWSPPAFWGTGSLTLRQPQTKTWQVMVLSKGGEPFEASGSYGIRARNGSNSTQIDAVNKVLSVTSSGSFSFGGTQAGLIQSMTVSFPSAITTYERPLVFFNAANYMMVGKFRITGAPGNWTGFTVRSYSYAGHGDIAKSPQTIKWFCASYRSFTSSPGQYGASVKDAAGNLLFITTANLSLLNSQPANNSFVVAGTPITGSNYYDASYQMAWTGSYDDYVLANSLFSMTNIIQTTQPYRTNYGGFLPGNRNVLQMFCENVDGVNPVGANGRTLFASRPMKPL